MSTSGKCCATVVLLCMGRGGDPNSFRPNRDESQWWSRRDALVRCVASFLFGPSPGGKDMILLFDDDWAQAHLSIDPNAATGGVPTEKTILSLFKKAAQTLNTTITHAGLKCRIVLDPTLTAPRRVSSSTDLVLPNGLDSKRQILEYLQKKCSMDFLRDNGLNSNPTVILRKTNKKALMEVWNKWRRHVHKGAKSSSTLFSQSASIIEGLYYDIIETCTRDSHSDTTIAAALHETCEEFPCFQPSVDNPNQECCEYRVFFFLGAVRDMTAQENDILGKVCKQFDVPLVGIRLGTVAEFTSKILSVVALHHFHQSPFRCALQRLIDPKVKPSTISVLSRQQTCMHVICLVPLESSSISTDLAQRDRIHWGMVRVIVSTLWRSKLASSDVTAKQGHVNTLTFIFDDDVVLRLSEETFVTKLASRHQAAPSEHQVLAAVRSLLDHATMPENRLRKKDLAKQVFGEMIKCSPLPIEATISISPGGGDDNLCRNFYYTKSSPKAAVQNSIVAVLEIPSHRVENIRKRLKMQRAIVSACAKFNIPAYCESPVVQCTDYEATCVTCLQHFLYQNRLFSCKKAALSEKKRKSPA